MNNSSANVYAANNTTIYAQYDYWCPHPSIRATSDGSSTIYTNPNYDGCSQLALYDGNVLNKTNSTDLLDYARKLMKLKNYSEAFSVYQSLINSKPESNVAVMVVSDLGFLYRDYRENSIIDMLNSTANNEPDKSVIKATALEVLSNIYSLSESFDKMDKVNQKLIDEFKSTQHEKNARMNLFYKYYNQEQDSKALEVLSGISKDYAENDEVVIAKWLIESRTGQEVVFSKAHGNEFIHQEAIDPDSYSLDANYPNPFNPSTEISFNLPKNERVTLTVYDVLGKKVAELANANFNAGKHTVMFDASKLSSGVYIYILRAGSFTQSRKMLLMK